LRKSKVRVGIVGVGNCASSFVQGLSHYARAETNAPIPGLMHPDLGGYAIDDIEISAAFDVNAAKVGRDVGEAIFVAPNNTQRFAQVSPTGVVVHRGRTLDGLGKYNREEIEEADGEPADVTDVLQRSRTDVIVSYLPVGSQQATEFYAERALEAGCAFVNCIPVFIASNADWRRRFEQRGLPIIGDDIKSQVGATIVHRVLANLFRERGVRLDRTYQLNFGGNTDFQNMLERERLESKKISKTQSVTSQLDIPLPADDIHVGPSDFVPWLTDRNSPTSHGGHHLRQRPPQPRTEARSLGLAELGRHRRRCGRCAKLALDRGIAGALTGPSSYFMKSPPEQFTDAEARERTLRFIAGEA
jgi:myo-inositol-1-phosphate synthase